MNLPVLLVLYIMAAHWFADFVCQTHEMAINKSTSNIWLAKHVLVYTVIMAIAMIAGLHFRHADLYIAWVMFNGTAHFVTDYITSRFTSYFFKKQDFHNGFVVVGIDQYVHLTCLLLSTVLFM